MRTGSTVFQQPSRAARSRGARRTSRFRSSSLPVLRHPAAACLASGVSIACRARSPLALVAHGETPAIAVPIMFTSHAVIAGVIVVFASGVTDASSEEVSSRIAVSIMVKGFGRASSHAVVPAARHCLIVPVLHPAGWRGALLHSLLFGHRWERQGGSCHQAKDDPFHGFLPKRC